MLAVIFSLIGGCATGPDKPDTSKLVWPPPPEQPRIRYIAEYHSDADLRGRDLKASLLGVASQGPILQKPYGVAATPNGDRIFVTDTKLRSVMVFDLQGRKLYPFRTDAAGRVVSPIEVRVDGRGRVYVTDSVHAKVMVYEPDGRTVLALGKEEKLQRPTGLALDEKRGNIYVADTTAHRIVVYDMEGRFRRSFGVRGSEPGQLNYPVNLAVDNDGSLYVADTGNFRLQVYTPEGEFLKTFGQVGDSMGAMARPKGVALDSEGHIYVVDGAFNNFQIFDPDGKILLFVGSLGRDPGRFWIPTGIFIDRDDRIYVVDSINARIQVFQYLRAETRNKESAQ